MPALVFSGLLTWTIAADPRIAKGEVGLSLRGVSATLNKRIFSIVVKTIRKTKVALLSIFLAKKQDTYPITFKYSNWEHHHYFSTSWEQMSRAWTYQKMEREISGVEFFYISILNPTKFNILLFQRYSTFWKVVCTSKQRTFSFTYMQSYILTERELTIPHRNNPEWQVNFGCPMWCLQYPKLTTLEKTFIGA